MRDLRLSFTLLVIVIHRVKSIDNLSLSRSNWVTLSEVQNYLHLMRKAFFALKFQIQKFFKEHFRFYLLLSLYSKYICHSWANCNLQKRSILLSMYSDHKVTSKNGLINCHWSYTVMVFLSISSVMFKKTGLFWNMDTIRVKWVYKCI